MAKFGLKSAFAMALTICLSSNLVAETMYKWQDAKGITHYTQTPPKDAAYEVIEVKQTDSRGNRGVRSSQNRPVNPQQPSVAAAQTPTTDVERYRAIRNNNCELAKRNLNTLTTVARIRIPDGVGGERLLSDKEKSEKVALTQEQVKTFCSKENDLTQKQPAVEQ